MRSNPAETRLNAGGLRVRRAEASDIAAIVALVNAAYRGEPAKLGWTTEADLLDGQRTDSREVGRLLAQAASMILLGERAGEAAASVHLERREAGAAYLGMLAVRPRWQSQGLGKRMIAEAEAAAQREWGAEKMLMTVISLRVELLDVYGRYGYRRTGRLIPFPAGEEYGIQKVPGLQLEFLEKPLAPANKT